MLIDKLNLLHLLLKTAQEGYDAIQKNTSVLSADVRSVESKQEGKYDTRALLNSYLAGAQEARLKKLEGEINLVTGYLDKINKAGTKHQKVFVQVYDLVQLHIEEVNKTKNYFIVPALGGYKLEAEGREILSLTPETPIGKILLNQIMVDDAIMIAGSEATVVGFC